MSEPLAGSGVHGGRHARVWLHRHEGPLCFRCGRTLVPADVDHVIGTDRCTVLGTDAARVAVVEHLLAACHATGFWSGVLVEIEGDELPILDGSAGPWAERLLDLGPPPDPPAPLVVDGALGWREGNGVVRFAPGRAFLDVTVAYDHPGIGAQRWRGTRAEFPGLLDARTFGFAHELADLRARGLATGAVAGSGILFDVGGPSSPLRGPDEPVRHKALDALGDLALLGRPLEARVRIDRGSHRAHVEAMRLLLRPSSPTATERTRRR